MTFKASIYLFLISTAFVALLYYFFGISIWWFAVPILLVKASIIYGSAYISSDFYMKAFCNAETTEKIIALTFDDGPNPEFTPKVLKVLKEHSAPATFFVIGKNIPGNEDVLHQINSGGHIIGNHTFSHSFFIDFKSSKGFIKEIQQTEKIVKDITGKKMNFFRPPYGVTTPHLAKAVKELNYYTIGWDVRSLDTTNDSPEKIMKRIRKQIKPGSIILFHDTSDKTVEILKQTLNFAKENGFKIVSTERLLNLRTYEFQI
jgi:peptidoglycan/xylan/chitin deacetylase (PgdA/CDA1 family)